MSEQHHPVVMCDGEDGECGDFELDITLGGLAHIVGSETQLPDGWTGARPGTHGEHLCPRCSATTEGAPDA